MFGAEVVEVVLKKININAPIKPKTAPEIFSKVIFSRIKTADRMKTIIGEIVTITEEFIGVDKLKPLNEKSILMTIPNAAQPKMRSQSLRWIFSEGNNRLMHQNRRHAPKTLSITKPNGWIYSGIKPFARVWFMPKIKLDAVAANIAQTRLLTEVRLERVDDFLRITNKYLVAVDKYRTLDKRIML